MTSLPAKCFLVFILFPTLSAVCPTPLPCHCIGNQVIYCAFRRLTSLPYFLDFKSVWHELDLSENFISVLPPNGFRRSVCVRSVLLNRNIIASVSVDAFVGLGGRTTGACPHGPDKNDEFESGVTSLDLSHNRITVLPAGVFRPLGRHLKKLVIQYNRLTPAGLRQSFGDLKRLQELDLQGNELGAVPSESLSPLTSLRRLILRHTRLKHIESHAFAKLTDLEHLDLGNNALPLALHDTAFCGLRSEPAPVILSSVADHDRLQYTNLRARPRSMALNSAVDRKSYNTVVIVSGGDRNESDYYFLSSSSASSTSASSPVNRKLTLRLDHNGMTSLSPCLPASLQWSPAEVDLTGNPLHCDCALLNAVSSWRQLHQRDVKTPNVVFTGAQCASPSNRAGIYLNRPVKQLAWCCKMDSSGVQLCPLPRCPDVDRSIG